VTPIRIGFDIAKNVFQVHGVDDKGTVVIRKRVRRPDILRFFASLPPCLIGIEACSASHHWARELIRRGHEVRLMPARYVKPYVQRGKSDALDAEAICEAVGRPTMRFATIKTTEQQAVLTLHRARELLVKQQTMLANLIRGCLGEFGIVAPLGIRRVSFIVRTHCKAFDSTRKLLEQRETRSQVVCRTDQDDRALALVGAVLR
jgi:transposase